MHRRVWPGILTFFFLTVAASATLAQSPPLEIDTKLHKHFRFVAYGDTRFTDPHNTKDANPEVRQQLVSGIAAARPDFITFGGDIALNGDNANDWKEYDAETLIWRERRIPVYPALGNHDLHGDINVALGNYFSRFPVLQQNRFYAVRTARTLMLTLDSALDETTGPQGEWLQHQLASLRPEIDFVFIVMHHPPYTSSSDAKTFGGGHSARSPEQKLAAYLEEQQQKMRARIVVFAGHVHNYERHAHGGVTYFVIGGGGAHAYPITRAADDLFKSNEVNYHYLFVEVKRGKLKATMNRLEIKDGMAQWTKPDSVSITVPKAAER